jgi:hypothetical protein
VLALDSNERTEQADEGEHGGGGAPRPIASGTATSAPTVGG